MFENEIKSIADFNLNKLSGLGNVFTLRDIKNCQIQPALFKYILASVENQLNLDIEKLKRNSPLDYSNEKINNYFDLIKKEIKRTKKFNRTEVTEIINKATLFNINFLTNPNKTLVNFIYSDDDLKSKEEILSGISHIYYYRYLQKILVTHIEKKNILNMRKSEFNSLLNRIDKISINSYLEESISTTINSLANFFDSNNHSPEKLPLSALEIYLNEKGLNEFWYKLKNHFMDDPQDYFSAHKIQEALNTILEEPDDDISDLYDDPKFFGEQINIKTEIYTIIDEPQTISDSQDNQKENSFEISDVKTFNAEQNQLNTQSSEEQKEGNISTENFSELPINENVQQSIDEVREIQYEINKPENIKYEEALNQSDSAGISETENKSEISPEIEKFEEQEIESAIETEKSIKVKPDARKAIDDLINTDNLYKDLLSVSKPFEDENYIVLDNDEFDEFLNTDLNYKIDYSTLSESLSENIDFENIETQTEKEEIVYDDTTTISNQESFEQYDEKIETAEVNLTDTENIDALDVNLDAAIDEVVSGNISQQEGTFESFVDEDQETIESQEKVIYREPLKDEELKLIENDDEKTEVFSDLTFLEREENDLTQITNTEITDENVANKTEVQIPNSESSNKEPLNDLDEESQQDSDNEADIAVIYKTFQEMIGTKDMSGIIENIFDYDMEDYRSTISSISESKNEEEAFQITDNYCKKNHIDQSIKEIDYFKNLISIYFSQPK